MIFDNIKKISTILILIIIFIITSISITAQDYYGDVQINVNNEGLVTISGETNHPLLNTINNPDFTSKKGKYWLLNITINDTFSDLIYYLNLPKNSNINYLKTPSLRRIEDTGKGIQIIGTAKNSKISLVVQYQIDNKEKNRDYIIALLILGVLIITSLILYFISKRYSKKENLLPNYNPETLTTRQKEIIEILKKAKDNTITQANIEKQVNFPKSSLSRNIDSLVRKGIILKESKGMSNVITFKKKTD